MPEPLSDRAVLEYVFALLVLVLFMTAVSVNLLVFSLFKDKRKLPCCPLCGRLLPREPVREVALEDQSLLVYACACGAEAFLSNAHE